LRWRFQAAIFAIADASWLRISHGIGTHGLLVVLGLCYAFCRSRTLSNRAVIW
jgi:hypothetical protein